jgi:hypothetical protein
VGSKRNLQTVLPLLFAGSAMMLSAAIAPAQQPKPAPAALGSGPGEDGQSLRGVEPKGPLRPTARGIDGKPDFTGYWKPLREAGKPGGNMGKDQPGFKLPFTAAGRAALDYNLTKTIDPEALCILGGIPRHNASGLPFEILHTPQRLAFLYLYNTHRFVPLDGRQRDPDQEPRYFGNPIGHWEGDVLVIETSGLHDSADGKIWLDENANPTSDETVVIEKWTRPDADHVHLEMTITDPKYYTKPVTFARTWVQGKSREGLNEYACNENNIDAAHIGPGPGPIGPDGNRGGGYDGKSLPKVPPPPPEDYYDAKNHP